jgi:hypothetical protein
MLRFMKLLLKAVLALFLMYECPSSVDVKPRSGLAFGWSDLLCKLFILF